MVLVKFITVHVVDMIVFIDAMSVVTGNLFLVFSFLVSLVGFRLRSVVIGLIEVNGMVVILLWYVLVLF